jgi:hypothetical protein
MSVAPDFVVESPDRQVQLVVEAKTKAGASEQWAARMRRNLVVHGTVPLAPYFLLALPTHFFLWQRAGAPEALPDFDVDPRDMLRPYFESKSSQLDELSEESFELVVRAWLDDLVRRPRVVETPQTSWLFRSGLLESIRHGEVRSADRG